MQRPRNEKIGAKPGRWTIQTRPSIARALNDERKKRMASTQTIKQLKSADDVAAKIGNAVLTMRVDDLRDAIRAEIDDYFSCPRVSGVELSPDEVSYIIGGILRRLSGQGRPVSSE